ncbi:MAG TPA: MoaD/ThiS family protein [Thermoplasmata archaeon]|nr:MoaD/ThiS family protein [Thermoplasmata archaeon]HEV2429262.1 MoaD/ThiS family protein [Thermoplasmata archaeon]
MAVERGGRSTERSIPLEPDDTVRTVLGRVGLAAEGCAVFRGGRSIPLDAHVSAGDRLEVVPTFSGG